MKQPVLSPVPGKSNRWRLVDRFDATTSDGQFFSVPLGMITDLASVPRFLWWLVGPSGDHLCAALIHDSLWAKLRRHGDNAMVRRADADAIFLDLLEQAGIRKVKRYAMWATVRVAGGRDLFQRGISEALKAVAIVLVCLPIVVIPAVVVIPCSGLAWLVNRIGGR